MVKSSVVSRERVSLGNKASFTYNLQPATCNFVSHKEGKIHLPVTPVIEETVLFREVYLPRVFHDQPSAGVQDAGPENGIGECGESRKVIRRVGENKIIRYFLRFQECENVSPDHPDACYAESYRRCPDKDGATVIHVH